MHVTHASISRSKPALSWRHLVLFASAVLAVALRCVDLATIPGWVTDEGFWGVPPRDFVLFGQWAIRSNYPYYHQYLSPLFSALLVVDFRLLGPGIVQARALTVLLGFLTVLMTARLGRLVGPPRVANLAALALAFDGSMVVLNRTAIIESLETFLLVSLAVVALCPGRTRRLKLAVVLGLALLTKLLSAYAAPVLILHTWLKRGWREGLYDAVSLGIGFLLAGLVFTGLALNDRSNFLAAWGHEFAVRATGTPRGEGSLAATVGYFVTREPILLLALAATSIWKIRRGRFRDGQAFVGRWLVVGIVTMAVQGYAPDRYFMPLIPFAWLWIFLVIGEAQLTGAAVRSAFAVSLGLLLVHIAFSVTSFVGYYYVLGHRNPDPVQATQWIDDNATVDQRMLAPFRLVVSTKVPAVGMEAVPTLLSPKEFDSLRFDYVVIAPDTRSNPNSLFVEADRQRYRLVAQFGEIKIYRSTGVGSNQ